MLVSIVSAYTGKEREGLIEEFLDNIEVPSYAELIIVNAGGEPVKNDKITKLISLKENKSFSNSFNKGIMSANGDYIVIINIDCLPTPKNWLWQMIRLMIGTGASIISPTYTYPSPELYKHVVIKEEDDYYKVSFYPAICWLIKKSVIEEIGLFDERFSYGCYEDNDYCKRVINNGGKILVNKNLKFKHYGGETMTKIIGDKNSEEWKKVIIKNKEEFDKKWCSSQ